VGDVITYTFTVENTGNVTLSDISITDALPGLSSISPATIATLAPGATTSFHGHLYHNADRSGQRFGKQLGDCQCEDPNGDPVSDSDTETVTASQTATLTLDKSASSATYSTVGDVITYTFTVENTGNVTLSDISITDALPGFLRSALQLSPRWPLERQQLSRPLIP
jgi:uncharacterized repeat protein (TIGR01451 family)